jgi:hypothetical protein
LVLAIFLSPNEKTLYQKAVRPWIIYKPVLAREQARVKRIDPVA